MEVCAHGTHRAWVLRVNTGAGCDGGVHRGDVVRVRRVVQLLCWVWVWVWVWIWVWVWVWVWGWC